MSQACVILLSSGLTAVQENGNKFEIEYCLPVYDPATDPTVRTSPVDNAESESATATDPSDFHGVAFPRGLAYTLVNWGEGGSQSLVYDTTSGWKATPDFSLGASPVKALGGNPFLASGATVSGGTLSYTSTEPLAHTGLMYWTTSNLYPCVRFLGTKSSAQDTNYRSAYQILLRAKTGGTADYFVNGSIRFNKVILFQKGTSGLSPIAVVCLSNPVSIFGDVNGQSNSISVNINFGFDTTYTPQSASFDNSYWSKITGTEESVEPLYYPGRLVLGDNPDADGNVTIIGKGNWSVPISIKDYRVSRNDNPLNNSLISAKTNVFFQTAETAYYSRIGGGQYFEVQVPHYSGYSDLPTSCSASLSFVTLGGSYGEYTLENMLIQSSVVAGTDITKKVIRNSVVVGSYITGMPTLAEEDVHHGLNSALIVGESNNIGYPVYGQQRENISPDTTVVVGRSNNIYMDNSSFTQDAVSSRTFILGNSNEVKTGKYCSNNYILGTENIVSNYERSNVYVLGSNNTITNGSYEMRYTRFVFGDGLTIDESPVSQNYVYEDIFVVGGLFKYLKNGDGEKSPIKLLSIGVKNSGQYWNTGLIKLPINDGPLPIPNVGILSGFDIPVIDETNRPGWDVKGVISRVKKGTTLSELQQMIDAGYVPLFTYVGNNDD